jgi:hypothetical protein
MRKLTAATLGCCTLLWADFTYTEKTEITGGALKSMAGFARRMSGQGSGPLTTTHRIHGNKMMNKTGDTAQVIDLDAETLTDLNHDKKEYSVITFAQMAEAMKRMWERMGQAQKGQPNVQIKWNVTVETPGDTREVAGVSAKHALMTLEAEGADKRSGERGTMRIKMDTWMAKLPGSETQREFYRRMAEKMNFMQGLDMGTMMQAGPGAAEGFREAAKKMGEMEGMALATVVRTEGEAVPGMQGAAMPAVDPKAEAKETAAQQVLGRLGGFGGFGRRKKKEEAEPAPQGKPEPATSGQTEPGVLMEVTTEVVSFSSDPVDPSVFGIPAGYRKTQHPMEKMLEK